MADEPIGFCVGFKPDQEKLDELDFSFDVDEWNLVADDGSTATLKNPEGACVVFNGNTDTNDVKIRAGYPTQEELDAGFIPVGPDMLIFRSEDELVSYIEGLNS